MQHAETRAIPNLINLLFLRKISQKGALHQPGSQLAPLIVREHLQMVVANPLDVGILQSPVELIPRDARKEPCLQCLSCAFPVVSAPLHSLFQPLPLRFFGPLVIF